MKTETLELAVDAVADAVRSLLPELVTRAVEASVGPMVAAAIRAERELMLGDVERRIAAVNESITGATTTAATYTAELAGELGERIEAAEAALAPKIETAIRAERGEVLKDFERLLDAVNERITGVGSSNSEAWAMVRTELDTLVKTSVAAAVAALPPAAPGPRGEPGRDGRDGTFDAPVHWHEGRLYKRGSVVIHAGGVWVANVDTDAAPTAECSGYALLLDGVLPHEVEHDERGYVALAFKYASGRKLSVPMHFRPPLYCGVYDSERAYEPNDLVTCAGSLWWARAESRGAKPGTDAGARLWVLSVKCGRDGERGERGLPGVQGPAGPPGPAGRDAKPTSKRSAPSNGATP